MNRNREIPPKGKHKSENEAARLGSALQQARQLNQGVRERSPLERLDGEDPAFSLGAALKRARLRQQLELAEVEAQLRIRRIFLEAIETDRFEDLPGPAYITAFLRTYADLLGIPFQDVMERFERESAEKAKQQPKRQLPSPVTENHLPSGVILVIGGLIAALSYGCWVLFSGMAESPPGVVEDLSPPAEEILVQMGVEKPKTSPLIASDVVTPAPKPSSDTIPTAPLPEEPAQDSLSPSVETEVAAVDAPAPPVVAIPDPPSGEIFGTENANPRIVLRAEDGDCWFRIREADGRLVTERILRPGQSYQVPNRPDLTLSVGNAGALKLIVDGTTLPSLGSSGQVRNGIRLNPAQLLPAPTPPTN